MGERGSISLFGVGVIAVIAVMILLAGHLGAAAAQRARAAAIADVVAMAAATEPHIAEEMAAVNGAELVGLHREAFEVEVVVRTAGASAVARAELLPAGWWNCQSFPVSDPVQFESCPSTPPK